MEETPNYTQMGIAALIPGAQYVLAKIEGELDKLRAMLAAAQANGAGSARDYIEAEAPRKPDGRGSSWQGMTREERKAEGRRRAQKARENKAAKEANAPRHPSDPRHPAHEKWIANLRASQKKYWASKSKAARKAQIKKMHEGKAAKKAQGLAA